MKSNLNRFLDLARTSFKQNGWRSIPFQDVDLAFEKKFQTSIVQTVHRIFIINMDQMEKKQILQKIEEIHQQSRSQPPLFPVVNQLIFLLNQSFDISWLMSKAKKQDISTSVSTVSWWVDLTSKKLYIHTGRPLVKKGKKEIKSIIEQL